MNYNTKSRSASILEFTAIRTQLADLALTDHAKEKAFALTPSLKEADCHTWLRETSDARIILDSTGTPPLVSMKEFDKLLQLAEKGSMLLPEQLSSVASFLNSCNRMKAYLKRAELLNVDLAYYGASFQELDELFEEIDRCIRTDLVVDSASTSLQQLRRKIENTRSAIKAKLDSILRGKKDLFADSYVTTRAGRLVLPVKREHKNQIPGAVIDTSSTGSTCFIEPNAVRKLQDELSSFQLEEENEVRKILYTLTAMVDEQSSILRLNKECMETLDFIFAKAKLSAQMDAIEVPLITDRKIKIRQGRHPLLPKEQCVPLDFTIGEGIHGIVVTGPNTGGKTVALKTVGLLSMMVQCGLHVPVEKGSFFCLHNAILCDIGDGQSISENLSTFSAHISNIIEILQHTTTETLVLLDELGSGTDPAEGMGLAVAILEELRLKGCLFVATTHYPEIKEYAKNTESLVNARMEFDKESLQPLYRMEIGEAGESCALYIAQRLGLPSHLLKRAYTQAYGTDRPSSAKAPEPSFTEEAPPVLQPPIEKVQKTAEKRQAPLRSEQFQIGDSVQIYPQKLVGIVFQPADETGAIGVQVQGRKQLINHKRVKLVASAKDLYPEGYDFSIIFDSVENRKARRQMGKGHRPDLMIVHDTDLGSNDIR